MITRYFRACGLAVALAAGISGVAVASSHDERQGPAGFERERVWSIPIRPAEQGRHEIERVVLDGQNRALGVSARAGIVRESEDRIRLRGIPVIGQVFADRLTESDFAPEREVGQAYVEGRTLFVHLMPGIDPSHFDTVVLVHDKFSYRFQGRISEAAGVRPQSPRPVGSAYRRDGSLLVLIRPSIITDSLL